MRKLGIIALFVWVLGAALAAAPLKVVALHPLMADLGRQVGGARVEVVDLVADGVNPHAFEPKPSDLRHLREAGLILAAGKNMEPYLPRLRESLGGAPALVEVGRTIPSLTVGKDAVYSCCPAHAAGSLDPHWWQGVDNMRRAARVVADALAAADPASAEAYRAAAAAYAGRLSELKLWAKQELAKVPRGRRKLVTAHTAFAYFAKEFGFETIAVAGLTREQNLPPQELARSIRVIRESGVPAIFPEHDVNPKIVESIAAQSGARLAHPLISDGNGKGQEAGFEGMIRHNVVHIVEALAVP